MVIFLHLKIGGGYCDRKSEEKVKNFSILGEEKVKNSSLFLPLVGTLDLTILGRDWDFDKYLRLEENIENCVLKRKLQIGSSCLHRTQ